MIVKRNFSPGRILPYVWKELAFTLVVAGAVSFLHIEKGQDVPITALCTGIERDLREQLGDRDLPPAARPVDGYLF